MSNLEKYVSVETLILSGNLISELNARSFALNTQLQYLSLSRNKLTSVMHLIHLKQLLCLDLSHNRIEEVDLGQLPPNLLSLTLTGNPIEQRARESGKISQYRKPFVLQLDSLQQMDKIEIIAAEKMTYQGILPRKVNLDEMLRKKAQDDAARQQVFKMQSELRVEIQREQGKPDVEIIANSLDEFAKMDEMDGWLDNLTEVMHR